MHTNQGFKNPFEPRLPLSALRREFAAMFAKLEELRWLLRHELEYKDLEAFGQLNLKVFSLAVEVTRLKQAYSAYLSATGDHFSCGTLSILRVRPDLDYSRMLEKRTEQLINYQNYPPLPKRVRTVMTCRLRDAAMQLHPLITGTTDDDAEKLFNEILDAYRSADTKRFNRLLEHLDEATFYITETSDFFDREYTENLKRETARLHAELEEASMAFPYTLQYRLDDPEWVEAEKERLNREIGRLTRQKKELRKLLGETPEK